MALSQADFYAYSRATGAPVPEDPRERAEMAPEVLAFRRNQLKAPEQQGPDPVSVGIGVGLALAGAGGALFGARRLMRGPKQSATAGVRQVNLAEMAGPNAPVRRVATEPTPEPSKTVSSTGLSPVDLAEEEYVSPYSKNPTYRDVYPSRFQYPPISKETIAARRQAETQKGIAAFKSQPETYQLELKGEVSPTLRSIRSLEIGPNLTQIRRNALGLAEETVPEIYPFPTSIPLEEAPKQLNIFSPRSYLEQKGSLAPVEDLTSVQQQSLPQVIDQKINAVESGEDQVTGRVIKELTIADPWGEAVVPPSTLNKQTLTTTPLLPPSATSLRDKAQSFLQSRFEELGNVIPGRYRRERLMGQDPEIAEAMELYASTGDPSVLSRLSQSPSSPLTIKPITQTELLADEIPTGKFFQTTGNPEFTEDLFEKDIKLTNRISSLAAQKQNIANRIEEINQLEPQLRFAARNESGQGGYYTRMLGKLKFEQQSLNPESVNADLGDAIAQRDFVRGQLESFENLGPQFNLIKRQEGVRPFYEVDPVTGEPIAETLEIRSGRPTIDTERKGGGGRNVAEFVAGGGNPTAEAVRELLQGGRKTRVRDFDIETGNLPQIFEEDRSQVGRSIGIYGIEPRNKPIADPGLKPTVLQREETKMQLRRGEYPKFQAAVKSTPEQKLSSVNMSQAVLRAAQQQASRNPRGGVLPDEITILRRQLAQPVESESITYGPRSTLKAETALPQQLGIKGVTGYSARRVDSPADIAANQLEQYMGKLQRGRLTPLTSEVVIQPRLF